MKKENIRITCAQIHSSTNDKDANLKKIKQYIDQAMETYPDTDLILFPELALTGCECTQAETRQIAELLEGPSVSSLAAYARQKNVFLVFGFVEKEEKTDATYNSAALISNKGEILGQYRKMHLVEEEKSQVVPGNSDYPVFDTEIGKIGIMICWDSAFPEVARILSVKGADYILVPAAWEVPMQSDWDLIQKARAFDNVIFTACCNQTGADRHLNFFGKSKILAPKGEVLVEGAEDKECLISVRFNYQDKQALRDGYYALLRDRRPQTYEALAAKDYGNE